MKQTCDDIIKSNVSAGYPKKALWLYIIKSLSSRVVQNLLLEKQEPRLAFEETGKE